MRENVTQIELGTWMTDGIIVFDLGSAESACGGRGQGAGGGGGGGGVLGR